MIRSCIPLRCDLVLRLVVRVNGVSNRCLLASDCLNGHDTHLLLYQIHILRGVARIIMGLTNEASVVMLNTYD